MKIYRRLLLLLVAFLCGASAMAQSNHIGNGQMGAFTEVSRSMRNDTTVIYVRACSYYYWGYGVENHRYTASTVAWSHFYDDSDFSDLGVFELHLTVEQLTYELENPLPACDSIVFRNHVYYTTYSGAYSMVQNEGIYNRAGCDSIYNLTLTIAGHSSQRVYDIERCNSFYWPINYHTYTASTTDTLHTYNTQGCDSSIILNLTIYSSTSNTDVQSACDRYTWQGSTYTTSGNRTKTLKTVHNCDSTVTLQLTIRHSDSTSLPALTRCNTYTWNTSDSYANSHSHTYTTSGNYRDTLTNVVNCDSILKLPLTINYSTYDVFNVDACNSYTWNNHGSSYTRTTSDNIVNNYNNNVNCPSADTLHLHVYYSTSNTDVQSVCDSYTWQGSTYTATTTDQKTLKTVHQCDSVVTLNLTVRYSNSYTEKAYGCYEYDWHGQHFTSSNNTAQWTGTNADNCDSVVTLDLTIQPFNTDTTVAVACDHYTWNGTTFTSSVTNETRTMPNHFGCDSIDVLNLTIKHSSDSTLARTACDNYTWTVSNYDGSNSHVIGTYNASTNSASATVANAAGCDSVITLHLTIHNSNSGTCVANGCDSYNWKVSDYGGANEHSVGTYTVSNNTATATVANRYGCDSLVTLNLTMHYSSAFTDVHDVCDSYTWINGSTYTAGTNTPTHVIPNAVGCDSVITLHLTVRYSTSSNLTKNECDSFHWDATNMTYTTGGNYNAHFTNAQLCDSTANLHLTVRYSTTGTDNKHACDSYTWHGHTYTDDADDEWHTTNAAGCDSTAFLHLVMDATKHAYDTISACEKYTWINGLTYTVSNYSAVDSTISVNNCDSINHLLLTIHPHTFNYPQIDVCDSYTWIDTTFLVSGVATKKFADVWGCDSNVTLTVHVFHADSNTIDNINTCDSYTWPTNGQTYTSSISHVRETLHTVHMCDSICTLNLTLRHSSAYTDPHDVCDSLVWMNGHKYTADNTTDTVHLANSQNCDSVITLNLHVRYSSTSTDSPNVCDSYTWTANGVTYTTTGVYHKTLTNADNCDSLLTLNLKVRHRTDSTLVESVCDSYTWHGNTYTASTNTPTFDTVNAAGCDSTAHLHLTVRYSTTGIDTHNECDAYTWHNHTYTASTDTPTYHTLNAVNCDSTATLHLTIRYSSTRTDADNVCDSYTWTMGDGHVYTLSTDSATYNVPGGNAVGCDSVARLDLVVRHSTKLDVRDTACDSYEFRGNTYTASTVYPETITNAVGCDSVITLYLTMDFTRVFDDVHDTCDTYTWTNGTTYTASTSVSNPPVQAHLSTVVGGCDSTSRLFLTIRNSSSYTEVEEACDSFLWVNNSLYYYANNNTDTVHLTNAVNCDSLITLNLTLHHSSHVVDTQNVCDSLVWHGNTYHADNATDWWNGTTLEDCDSIVTLNLTVRYSNSGIDTQDECDSYTWQVKNADGTGQQTIGTYTAATDTPTATVTNAAGCDSLVTLHLTVRYNSNTSYSATDCDMYVWPRNNTAYNTTQTALYPYTNGVNCPSVDTLYLTINYSSHDVFNEAACDSYTWNNHDTTVTYTDSGYHTYTHNYTNAVNCSSTDTLHLNVSYNTSTGFHVDTCDSYTWSNHGLDTLITTSGTYYHEYNTAAGCPSVDTLYAVIRYSSHQVFDTTVCDSYHWDCHEHHQDYTQSGNWYHEYVNDANCPSADTLHLTVNYNSSTLIVDTACDSYLWVNHGYSQTFDTTGTYTHDYAAANGCPSTDTLQLMVKYNTDTAYTADACDQYTWDNHGNSQTYYVGGTYTNEYISNNGCASVDTLHLNIRFNSDSVYTMTACDTYDWVEPDTTFTYTVGGTYAHTYTNGVNCVSTDTLHLTVHYKSDSVYVVKACEEYYWASDNIHWTFSIDTSANYTNEYGCASHDSLSLTIYHKTNTAYSDTACDMYVWALNSNTAYNESGDKYRYYMNADSVCQNVDTLHLTVFHNTSRDSVANACDSFRWVNYGLDTLLTASDYLLHDYLTADGCPSTDTLHLTVNYNTNSDTVVNTCDYFDWTNHGTALPRYDSTGVYTHDYLTLAGCPSTDTLHLTIRYNSNSTIDTVACDRFDWVKPDTTFTYTVGGSYVLYYNNDVNCASIDTLNLTVYYNTNETIDTAVCETYLWPRTGITYTFDSTFVEHYFTDQNCPSVDTLKLTVFHKTDTCYIDTACDMYMWSRNNYAYNQSGTYYYNYYNDDHVCVNVDTLKLKLWYYDLTGSDTADVCDSITWNGKLYTATGNYTNFDTLHTVHGCDSICVLHLTVHHSSDTLYTVPHACDQYIWNRDSVQLVYTAKGTYTHFYKNEWGCESVDTLQLMLYHNTDTIYIDTACDQYTWRPAHDLTHWNALYTHDTIATYTYNNDVGCTSHDTLYLTVYPSPRGDETWSACDSLLWRDGNYYYTTTDFPTDTAPSNVWCDSIITLHLTINHRFELDSTDFFCDSSTYIFHDSTIYTPGYYTYYGNTSEGCDSIVHIKLVQLPKPKLSIEESHSCETYEYTLQLHRDDSIGMPLAYTWSAEPTDLTLNGQESDTTIVVHPVRNTVYSVFVEYDGLSLPLCSDFVETDTLVPIMQPHSIIKTTPPYVQAGDVSFRAEDKSYDYTSRAWYVNGEYWGDNKDFEYSAPASSDDSVELMLISMSPTCTDTAFLLVPIYNFTLYIPNIFTPTEPINKTFKVTGRSVHDFEMWIYTREGLLVYHSTDMTEGWDGRHKGELCHQAAYVYHVRYTNVVNPEAWHTVTGTVMLIR